jgi:hypothetical protein
VPDYIRDLRPAEHIQGVSECDIKRAEAPDSTHQCPLWVKSGHRVTSASAVTHWLVCKGGHKRISRHILNPQDGQAGLFAALTTSHGSGALPEHSHAISGRHLRGLVAGPNGHRPRHW